MNNNKQRYFWLIIGILPAVILAIDISDIWNAKQSNSWPSTRGRIIESYVSKRTSRLEGVANVRYEYRVGNVVYSSDRLSYSSSYSSDYANPSSLNAKFYQGAEVSVYYDPSSPSHSVLIPGYRQTLNDFSAIISGSYMLILIIAAGWITRNGWPVTIRKIGKS